MAAFETALEHGSPRIELDVQMTADGVAVVTHDTSLRRCTGCNANIYDLPMHRCSSWMPGVVPSAVYGLLYSYAGRGSGAVQGQD